MSMLRKFEDQVVNGDLFAIKYRGHLLFCPCEFPVSFLAE
jgi:hypothetical protein